MQTIQIEVSEEIFLSLKETPEEKRCAPASNAAFWHTGSCGSVLSSADTFDFPHIFSPQQTQTDAQFGAAEIFAISYWLRKIRN